MSKTQAEPHQCVDCGGAMGGHAPNCISSLKPEAQRILIAEACGWTNIHAQPFTDHLHLHWTEAMGTPPTLGDDRNIPDYLDDLNAMHEAEKVLIGDYEHGENGRDASARFYDELISVTTCDGFFHIHATAAQRAEAFLRTLGKWQDAP